MKILFAASESSPYIKSGGLADVLHSLPKELSKRGHDVRVVIPLFKRTNPALRENFDYLGAFHVKMPLRTEYAGVFSHKLEGVTYYFIDNEHYFFRDSLYGQYDDGERFSFFSHAILRLMEEVDFYPDILHLNDWHTGAAAALFKNSYAWRDEFKNTRVVFTIHNLKYQGIFPYRIMKDYLGLDDSYFTYEKLEHYGSLNFMKAGIQFADVVTTVSRSYAKEITYPYFGEGLHGLLQHRKEKLVGIVNGIDYDEYNPSTDGELWVNFNSSFPERRLENKMALQKAMGLTVDQNIPMLAMVTRLVDNKGLDLLSFIFDELMEENVQFILLGSGDRAIEDQFVYFQNKYPQKVSTHILFGESLARKIYGSCDIFLMPSRFEPCGLGQLIAMRYGSIPVVRKTGGLADTVIPYNRYTGLGTGFAFDNYNAHELLFAIKDALYHYKDSQNWWKIVKQAMEKDLSWKESAALYEELYEGL
ncbi:MAG: glycogen synthase GlgA [Tissierellia bacterium]|nr:glycogen synthase GlgA [Tissierellia bacterium]